MTVNRPPASDTFVRLPDGRFNPRTGSKNSLSQSGARQKIFLAPQQYGTPQYVIEYANIGFAETLDDGSTISFSNNDLTMPDGNIMYVPYLDRFKPDVWSFPDGMNVTFSYNMLPDAENTTFVSNLNKSYHSVYVLNSVSNSFGRSLTFAADSGAANDPDGYTTGFKVTDDSARTVYIRANNALLASATGAKSIALDGSKTIIAYDRSDAWHSNLTARINKIFPTVRLCSSLPDLRLGRPSPREGHGRRQFEHDDLSGGERRCQRIRRARGTAGCARQRDHRIFRRQGARAVGHRSARTPDDERL